MMLTPNMNEIGGGVVRRRFSMGGRTLISGDQLSADEIRAIPVNNRNALINNSFIEVFRADPAVMAPAKKLKKGKDLKPWNPDDATVSS